MLEAAAVQSSQVLPAAAELEPEEDLSIWAEFALFLRENKKWWLAPVFVTTALIGGLVVLGATPLGPFIYSLF